MKAATSPWDLINVALNVALLVLVIVLVCGANRNATEIEALKKRLEQHITLGHDDDKATHTAGEQPGI